MEKLKNLNDRELIGLGLIMRNIKYEDATLDDNTFALEDAKIYIKGNMKCMMSLAQCLTVSYYLNEIGHLPDRK